MELTGPTLGTARLTPCSCSGALASSGSLFSKGCGCSALPVL